MKTPLRILAEQIRDAAAAIPYVAHEGDPRLARLQDLQVRFAAAARDAGLTEYRAIRLFAEEGVW